MIKRIFLLFAVLCSHLFVFSQNEKVEMADGFRSNGKIYVVVAVILTIFAGIIFYLVRLDRKITKIEKDNSANDFLNNK
ncbi:MAG: CcmD family protein [Chitinophagaceae bacterium]